MTISQRQGVYNAVEAFLKEHGREIDPESKVVLATAERKAVIAMLVSATEAGELTVKSEKARADLPKYWDGTLSNWLRKDERLNGGVEYQPKNPGSRAGAGDEELKNLKLLLKQVEAAGNEKGIEEVKEAIEARKAAIIQEKAAKIAVNTEVIPESLRHLVQNSTDGEES